MKSFRIPIFKKISGALGKALGNTDSALVAREDGFYRASKVHGNTVERKIFDESHTEDLRSLASGLGENIGAIRKVLKPGDALRAEEMDSVASGEATQASITGTTSVSPAQDFQIIKENLDNLKISFKVNSVVFADNPMSLQDQKFPEQVIVNHVNYAGLLNAVSKRGMTVKVPVTGKDVSIINKLSIYLKAGETYSIKIYDGDTQTSLIKEETINASYTKFYNISFDDYVLNNNGEITIIVEGTNFDYYYPVATPNYTASWSESGKDAELNIENTLAIKLNAMPAIALNPNDVSSLNPFLKQKIEEVTGKIATITYTDKFEIKFPAGHLEFEIIESDAVDIAPMLGFTSGKVTVFGSGFSAEDAPGKLVRLDENGKIPSNLLP